MPLVLAPGVCLFFVHVPKTGGTSVEDYLHRRFGPLSLLDQNKRNGVRGTGLIIAITHVSAVDLAEMIPVQADLVFALVRDPSKRLQSEYRWQSGASRASRLSFSTWLRVMERCASIDPRAYGNHIRPQSDLVPDTAEVFRLEDGFDALVTRIDAVTGSFTPDVAFGHFKKTGKEAGKIRLFKQDAEIINRLYASDFDRFGYTLTDPNAYPDDPIARLRDVLAWFMAPLIMFKQRIGWLR